MDIRLKTVPFDFQGKTYHLACNMNVLADVQEAYEGDFSAALEDNTPRSSLAFLAAMLNDSAESLGYPERFTAVELGRAFGYKQFQEIRHTVMELVIDSVNGEASDTTDTTPAESDAEKKGAAREDAAASTLPGI